jgi:hypothetical protein
MRFLSRAPAGPDRDGNWYSYALANPLRFVDRTGANGTIIPAGGSVPPLNDNPAIRGLRSMAAGTPGYVPPRQMADRAVAEQIAAGFDRNAPLTGRAVAQDTLNRIGRGELQINVAPSGVANNPNEILRGGVVSTPGNTVANVYSNPVAGRPRDMALTTLHEGTHVEQLQRPRPVGQYLSQVPSEHVPNTQLHELGAELNRWRGDPTLETGEYVRLSDLPEYVAKKHTKVGADGTVTDLIPKSNPSEVKVTRSWPGTMQITEDGNIIPGNRSFEQRVEKLRTLQRQQAVDNVSRLPGKVPLEPRISSNTVDLAVSREVSAAEHVLQETRTIGARVANALDSAGDKAASKLAGLYDATASSLGRLGSKAAKVLSYLADTGAGRFAHAVVPAVGQVAGAIGLMEGAHWLGQNVGEMAADVVINIRKKLDKALDALDKLGKDIAAQDTPPKKKKRLAELVNRGSAEPQQIGYAPLHDGPPGGSASNQPPGASAANPPGSSTGPAPTQTPGGLAPPQRPLGGSAANQPGQQPPREQGARPDQQPQQRPPEQRPPHRLPPNAPRSGALNQPRNNPPGAPAAPQRDFAGMCGSDFRQSVQRMLAGQLSGEQATQCNCYFWDKGGRPDTVLFNGRRAADLCAQSMASVAPPPPPPPPPPRPAAPPPPEPVKDKPADPPAAKPKEDKPTDWCAYFGQAPCPGLSPDQARQAIADAEFKKHLREELEKKKRELGPKFDEWANSPPSPDKPWRPPSPSSQPPVTGHIDPKPVTASPPASGSGGASNFFGAVANTLYGGAQALDRLNSHIK